MNRYKYIKFHYYNLTTTKISCCKNEIRDLVQKKLLYYIHLIPRIAKPLRSVHLFIIVLIYSG